MISFKDYLLSKKNFIIKWFIFHSIALFINFYDIDIEFEIGNFFVRLFQNSRYPAENDFYPFVKFFQWGLSDGYRNDRIRFNGIFFEYDFSEFIAYSAIIFIYLYFKYQRTLNK